MIQDSGERREFESGAVRDIDNTKGRCDLLPLYEVAELIDDCCEAEVIRLIAEYVETKDVRSLYTALKAFVKIQYPTIVKDYDYSTAILELSKHFSDGAKKYGEYNWQKGIPTHSYLDSAIRHLLKLYRGDDDERHDRAFMWNIICLIWTVNNKPELDDIGVRND